MRCFKCVQGVASEDSPAIAGIGSEDEQQCQGKRCDVKDSRHPFIVSQVWQPVTSWLQGTVASASSANMTQGALVGPLAEASAVTQVLFICLPE